MSGSNLDAMDWWEWLVLAIIAIYILTWRGLGPLGQPKDPPFLIWPDVWRFIREKLWSS
ncbi:MAG: hypothetical protein WCP68_03150 [Enhydrobacter sp.]